MSRIASLAALAAFDLTDKVWPKVGDQAPGIVIGAAINPRGIEYKVSWGKGQESWHYGFEITKERLAENS